MSTTVDELVSTARARIRGLTPGFVEVAIYGGQSLVVDVREVDELDEHGRIPGTLHAPRGMLEFWADPASPLHRPEFDPKRPTILVCATGSRSALAAETLHRLGYADVAHLEGGFQAWKAR